MQQRKKNMHYFRLSPQHRQRLQELSSRSGLSMSAVVRLLIDGATIRETPPVDYRAFTAELRAIGTNLNQIAYVANATGAIEAERYLREAASLRTVIQEIRRTVELR